MPEPNRQSWHQRTWVRILILILIPLIAGSLYLIAARITLQRTVPVETESPAEP